MMNGKEKISLGASGILALFTGYSFNTGDPNTETIGMITLGVLALSQYFRAESYKESIHEGWQDERINEIYREIDSTKEELRSDIDAVDNRIS